MPVQFKAWLIIFLAVVAMTIACFCPAVEINGQVIATVRPAKYLDGEAIPGWSAAVSSGVGIVIIIAEGNIQYAGLAEFALGFLANVLFLGGLISVMLRW